MKAHTTAFKDKIKLFGKELDGIITYENNNEEIELGIEELNSISSHYEGGILKSVMKQLDIDSNYDIPVGTIINYQFGVKTRNNVVENYRDNYDYVDFGNYIVYSSEKKEDTRSYNIICYDKMLYSMKDYENSNITFPITIRDYINAICTKLGLTFKNASSTFANYDKILSKEKYLDENGNSLGYKFRDVLNELAQVTASTICINEDDDELEIRYINNTNDTINEQFLKDTDVNVGELYGPINTIVLSRSAESDNIYYPSILPQNPKEIKIVDNQIMNDNNRDTYMADIYDKLNGLQFYSNDYQSTGICYYNLCDRYNIQIGNNTYSCVMFNDEVNYSNGLEEIVYTDQPEESVTEYSKADKTDRKINQAYLMVDKQNQTITGVVSSLDSQNNRLTTVESTLSTQGAKIDILGTNINPYTGEVESVKTIKGYTFDENGLSIKTDEDTFNVLLDNLGMFFKDGNSTISQFTKDNIIIKDIVLYGKYYYGVDSSLNVENFTKDDAMFVGEKYTDNNSEEGFGHFYNGL